MSMRLSDPLMPTGDSAMYRFMVERAPILMAVLDEGTFRFANPAAQLALGYSPDELVTTNLVDLVPPDQRDCARGLCSPKETDGLPEWTRLDVIRKDDRLITLEFLSVPIPGGGRPRVQIIGREMSGLRQHASPVLQSEKADAIGRFISAVAHELNNPLTVVVGFAEILLSGLDLNEQDKSDLEMIASEADRARQMLHDLLKLTRVSPQQKQNIQLNQLITTLLDQYLAGHAVDQIGLVTELAPGLPPVHVDPTQLKEALTYILNFLRRGIMGRDVGRMRVETSVQSPPDRVGADPFVQVTVGDDAAQYSPDELDRLFEPRYSRREEDYGLGLALASNLIRAGGGVLSATCSPHSGLRFYVRLPVARTTEPPQEH